MFDLFTITAHIKKLFTKREVILILCLIALFFTTRLVNLEKLPIFADEGIYIHWAQTAWKDASMRFVSLTDGRQPLQTWATIPFLKLFSHTPLFAGRLFAVSTGFVALVGIFSLLMYVFNKKTAFWGALFYIVTPFFLFYDRIALVDSGVNAAFIWILFGSIVLVKTLRLDVALILGSVMGFSLLTKSSAQLFCLLSTFAPVIIFEKKRKPYLRKVANFAMLLLIAGGIAVLIYNIQRLSPFLHYVAMKNTTFVKTFAEVMKDPFHDFWYFMKKVPYYVYSEMGWVYLPFSLLGFILLWKENKRLSLYLTIWLAAPLIAIGLISKSEFPRYFIFFASLFLIWTSYLFGKITIKRNAIIAAFVLLVPLFVFDSTILFKPEAMPLPEIDRGQYISGSTAGWGVTDIIAYAREKSKEKPVIILAEGNFGLVTDMLFIYIQPTDKIFIKGLWPLNEEHILENQKELAKNHVFIVFSHREDFPANWPIKLIKKYPKPNSDKALYLFGYKGQ